MSINNFLAPKRGRPATGRRIQPTTVAGRAELKAIRAELRKRILFTLGCLIVFRLGTYLPLPGVDVAAIEARIPRTPPPRR